MFRNAIGHHAIIALLAFSAAGAAQAGQTISAINTIDDGADVNENIYTLAAGGTAEFSYQGLDVRATTDYGVNRIYADVTSSVNQSATSAWLDTFTATNATGTGMVHVNFQFTVDGSASFPYVEGNYEAPFYYKVFALRGDGWSLKGSGPTEYANWYSPSGSGDDYDGIFIERNTPGAVISQFSPLYDSDGFYNYVNNAGEPGQFVGKVSYFEQTNSYLRVTDNGTTRIFDRYYSDRVMHRVGTSGPYTTTYYNEGTPFAAQSATIRASMEANYSLLDVDSLCNDFLFNDEECMPGTFDPTTLTLSFDVAAGSVFSIASIMEIDGQFDGTIDFYHTAKVSAVTVSQGGALTSQSGALSLQSDGTYGYPAAQGAVPEPATWAMMISGFVIAGGAMRRRRIAFA